MRLDASALNALNMFDNKRMSKLHFVASGYKITTEYLQDSSSSLYGILNCCKTPQGSRLLALWLKQPLMDVSELGQREYLRRKVTKNVFSCREEIRYNRRVLQRSHIETDTES